MRSRATAHELTIAPVRPAGVDFAFTVIARLLGPDVAQAMQLLVEYAPAPPFDTGSPERTPPALVDFVNAQIEAAFPQPKTYFAHKGR